MQPPDEDSEAGMPQPEQDPVPSSAARAEAAIRAIAAGADPGAEALDVANRFTDDMTSRIRGMFGRRRRGGGEPDSD